MVGTDLDLSLAKYVRQLYKRCETEIDRTQLGSNRL